MYVVLSVCVGRLAGRQGGNRQCYYNWAHAPRTYVIYTRGSQPAIVPDTYNAKEDRGLQLPVFRVATTPTSGRRTALGANGRGWGPVICDKVLRERFPHATQDPAYRIIGSALPKFQQTKRSWQAGGRNGYVRSDGVKEPQAIENAGCGQNNDSRCLRVL